MEDYLKGKENWLIRMYFYLTKGTDVVNNFRYIIAGVFALYVLLKLSNPLYMILMLLIITPILIVIGYYFVHKASKVMEYLNTKFSTHYGIKTFELMERQVELLEEIKKNGSITS